MDIRRVNFSLMSEALRLGLVGAGVWIGVVLEGVEERDGMSADIFVVNWY